MKYEPGDWVRVTFCSVGYRGRVSRCHVSYCNDWTYTVEYIDDGGNFKSGDFRDDEMQKEKHQPETPA